MRSLLIWVIALLLQFILISIAVHLAEKIISCLIDVNIRRCRRLPPVELLFSLRELPSPRAAEKVETS
jgi:hypothetical protein